jgi:hypothetical protein
MSVATIGGWWPFSSSSGDDTASKVTALQEQVAVLTRKTEVDTRVSGPDMRLVNELKQTKALLAQALDEQAHLGDELSRTRGTVEALRTAKRDVEIREQMCDTEKKTLRGVADMENVRNKNREALLQQQVSSAQEEAAHAHERENATNHKRDVVAQKVYDTLVGEESVHHQ